MRFAFGFLVATLMAVGSVSAADVRVLAQPFPPYSMHKESGSVEGFSIELFKLVQKELAGDPHQLDYSIVAVPFTRMYKELEERTRRISVALGKNPAREGKFKWAGPYAVINMGVIARRDSGIAINGINDFNGYRIASIANAAAEQALMRAGVKQESFDRTPRPEQALQKLALGRVDLMTHAVQSTSYLIKEMGFAVTEFEKVYNIKELDLYFAFSMDFSDAEIAAFDRVLKSLLGTQPYNELVDKYHLNALYEE